MNWKQYLNEAKNDVIVFSNKMISPKDIKDFNKLPKEVQSIIKSAKKIELNAKTSDLMGKDASEKFVFSADTSTFGKNVRINSIGWKDGSKKWQWKSGGSVKEQ